MKNLCIVIILFLNVLVGFSQDKKPPEYILNQVFPDSVLQFKLQDIKGNKVTFKEVLKQNRGSKVVIDFWASWCRDCIVGMPNLKSLIRQTKNVNYIFLSFDKTQKHWEKSMDKYHLEGYHYLIDEGWNNPISNYVDLDWIPRYMILDEHGKVIFSKAIKTSDKKFREILLK